MTAIICAGLFAQATGNEPWWCILDWKWQLSILPTAFFFFLFAARSVPVLPAMCPMRIFVLLFSILVFLFFVFKWNHLEEEEREKRSKLESQASANQSKVGSLP